jgi:hypothetical protein
MKYKTEEEYLWDLKMTLIKAFPAFLVPTLVLSQIFSSKDFARNSYLLLTFGILMMILLAGVEIIVFSQRTETRKRARKKKKEANTS